MKKKSIISFLAGASLLMTMPACTDLDETVYDNIPSNTFGSTQTKVNALISTVNKTVKNYVSDGNFL